MNEQWVRRAVACSMLLATLTGCAHPGRRCERESMMTSIRRAAGVVPSLKDDPVFLAALSAESRLPREDFVPSSAKRYAYIGLPLEIGWAQTISDPYVMALMTAAAKVERGARVLEIGTGSGYQAALLAEMGARVWTIEIVPQLASRAASTLRRRGYREVTVRTGDGFEGWPEQGPFDAVIVTAGSSRVPPKLLEQLRVGGRLVMPIGPSTAAEHIEVYTKRPDGTADVCSLGWAMFVPLTGKGFTPEIPGIADRSKPLCYGVPAT